MEILKVGLTPYQGLSIIGLLYGVDGHTWTTVTLTSTGKYDQFDGKPHGLDIVDLWSPLKAVKDTDDD